MYTKNKITCPNLLVVTDISVSGNNLLLSVSNTITPVNEGRYLLKCPKSLFPGTSTTSIYQILVSLNDTDIPLECKLGNYVYSDQIKCLNSDCCDNIILRLAYGSTPSHFKILNQNLCCSNAYGTSSSETSESGS